MILKRKANSNPKVLQSILKKALESEIFLDFSKNSIFSKFSCIKRCEKCCGYGYFLPEEIKHLPNRIKENLVLANDGKYETLRRNGRCAFYEDNNNNEFFCSIYSHQPLRCKIYPFFPLIIDQKIVITLEPALKMKNDISQTKDCPGIGISGKPLKKTVEDCMSFLKNLIDVPQLLNTIVLDNESFNNIRNDRWFIEYED